jgi:hypothetical protein
MSNHPAHVLLIEDNQGDADLVRLRLVLVRARFRKAKLLVTCKSPVPDRFLAENRKFSN